MVLVVLAQLLMVLGTWKAPLLVLTTWTRQPVQVLLALLMVLRTAPHKPLPLRQALTRTAHSFQLRRTS